MSSTSGIQGELLEVTGKYSYFFSTFRHEQKDQKEKKRKHSNYLIPMSVRFKLSFLVWCSCWVLQFEENKETFRVPPIWQHRVLHQNLHWYVFSLSLFWKWKTEKNFFFFFGYLLLSEIIFWILTRILLFLRWIDGGKNPVFQDKFVFTLIDGCKELYLVLKSHHRFIADNLIGSGMYLFALF